MRKVIIAGCAILTVTTIVGWICSYGGFRGSTLASPTLAEDGGYHLRWTGGYGLLAAECKYKTRTTTASPTEFRWSFRRLALEHEVEMLWNHDLYPGSVPYSPPVWIRRVWVQFPLWFPTIIFAAYPTYAFIRGPLRRYRRRKRGLCVTCGYNLTGLPEPRCPECGRSFGSSKITGVRIRETVPRNKVKN